MLLEVLLKDKSAGGEEGGTSGGGDREPTLEGDAGAFLGALVFALYLLIGRNVRSWCPVWLYVFPVVGFSVVTTVGAALWLDDATFRGLGPKSVFGFFSVKYIGYAIFLGGGAGVGGHTLINTIVKYISPVVISTSLLMEPLIGSLIGNALGVQGIPGPYTWVGGGILMAGLVLVVIAEDKKSKTADAFRERDEKERIEGVDESSDDASAL